jgi:hypothetical protein
VLRYDVMVDGIVLARIRLPVEISERTKPESHRTAEARFAKSAFASYCRRTASVWIDRVAAIRIAAKVEVFLDCHDLNPGEAWEPRLAQGDGCDTFLLFWSDAAAESRWVQWEWKARVATSPARTACSSTRWRTASSRRASWLRSISATPTCGPARRRARAARHGRADQGGSMTRGLPKLVIHLDPTPSTNPARRHADRSRRTHRLRQQRRPATDGARWTSERDSRSWSSPGSQDVVEANLERRFKAHEASDYKFTIVHPRSHQVHAEISGCPEYDAAGDVRRAIGFVTDKTMDRANSGRSTARSARRRTGVTR